MAGGRVTVLSRDELEAIHDATLRLLEEVGVLVREPRAQRLLTEAGALRDAETDRFRFPGSLVTSAVAAVPKQWTWYARESKHNLVVGEGGRTRLGPGSACNRIVDFDTGQVRPATTKDGDDLVRLLDALELVDISYTPVSFGEAEGPPGFVEVACMVRDVQNTSKVFVGPSYDGAMARNGLRIAAVLAGGEEPLRKRPMVAGYCDPVGPLIHDRAMTETLIEYASMGQPVFVTVLDLAGASAPPSLAGTLLQQNAEVLSGVVLAHLVNPKAPVIYGCVSGALDMRTGSAALGGPEAGLLSIASVQLAHFYGLPCTVGGQSDATVHDAQASLEKATTLLASVLAGADFVDLFFGSYAGYDTTSFEQIVLDHDIAGYAFRYAGGIEVNEETLGLDLLREVGPGGAFLRNRRALQFTRQRMRKEFYFPDVLRRSAPDTIHPRAPLDLLKDAHERAARLLREHRPDPMDPHQVREMERVLATLYPGLSAYGAS
jgi:trimethylamine---corrinoid protein Co-methyltransferase